jgi:NhaA family Na+:H+ antiporter
MALFFLLVGLETGASSSKASWRTAGMLASLSVLAGLGFTMSLFIAQLSFVPGPELAQSKAAILCASTLAAMVGMAMTRLVAIRQR